MLVCSLESVSGRYEVRAAPRIDLSFASLLCRAAARRKLLVLTLILADVLNIRSWMRKSTRRRYPLARPMRRDPSLRERC